MAKFKVGDKFVIKGEDVNEVYLITLPQDKQDKTYGFELISNRAIHGDVDEDLIIKIKNETK